MKNSNISIASETTTLATCWKLTLKDATTLGFTDFGKDITYDTVLYKADSGFTPTAISSKAGLGVDNLDVEGMLQSDVISEADLMAGKYDFAEIEIFLVNYKNLAEEPLILRKGWIGEIQITNGQFTAEIRGLTQKLSTNIGELFSPTCRVNFCDSKCKLNSASWTFTGTITAVDDNRVFTDENRTEDTGYFNYGIIEFTSGANDGLKMEIKNYTDDGEVELMLPMPYDVAVGDTYNITAGCDKRFSTCVDVFDNAVNFRGEPHLSGIDKMMQTAGTFK